VKVDQVESKFEDGIMTMNLPKAETTKENQISLKPKAKAEQTEAKNSLNM
jgi:hypothetical protein